MAAQQAAVTRAWHLTVWQLAWSLTVVQVLRGHRHDHLAVWRDALDASAHLPDPGTRMQAHQRLGSALANLGLHDQAITQLHQGLALAEEHHDLSQQADTHRILARTWEQQRDDRQALEHATRCLNLCRTLGQPVREAQALNQTGWHLARLGEFDSARTHCEAALAIQRRHSDPVNEPATLDSLGYIADHSGHHQQAIEYYQQALALLTDVGHIVNTANTLDRLGRPHAALGEYEQARAVWRQALQLYRQQGRDQAADRVQRQLDTLDNLKD